jgi:flagellar biosynthesis protein
MSDFWHNNPTSRSNNLVQLNMNPPNFRIKKAVALLYDRQKSGAPIVKASGQGELAGKILAVAEEAGIPIHEDPDLVEVLAGVPLEDEIPVELYQAVAEILSFVYKLNQVNLKENSHK